MDEKFVCQYCGKTITRTQSVEIGHGPICDWYRENGYTKEQLEKLSRERRTADIPTGFIKLARLHEIVVANREKLPGLSISKMVKAIGGDRSIRRLPAHPICTPVYDLKGHRWVNPWLKTKAGLTALQTGDFSKAPKPKA